MRAVDTPIINLLLVMVIVWTTGVLFRKIRQPPVLGELLAGILFGPAFLNIIRPDETLKVLSELGIFFLMFYAGLESNPSAIKRQARLSLFVAVGGFIVPFAMGSGVCLLLGGDLLQALFIGMALSITAIAVNARIMMDLKLMPYRVSSVIIGASIIDDVLSLAVFTVILDLASGAVRVDALHLLIVLMKVAVFFGVCLLIGTVLYPRLARYFATREAKGFTFALIMALLFGVFAEASGLHIILGAYMAGLYIREGVVSRELFEKISDRFVSITYGFLGPIFFVSLAFHVTFSVMQTSLLLLLILLCAAVTGKAAGAVGGALTGGMNKGEAVIVGAAMNGRGAVELIIASIGLELGIINDTYFSILVIIAFLTTLLPPVILNMIIKKVTLVQG